MSFYLFIILKKNKIKTNAFPVHNMVIGNCHVVPLGRCGLLLVMLGQPHFRLNAPIFPLFLLVIDSLGFIHR